MYGGDTFLWLGLFRRPAVDSVVNLERGTRPDHEGDMGGALMADVEEGVQ